MDIQEEEEPVRGKRMKLPWWWFDDIPMMSIEQASELFKSCIIDTTKDVNRLGRMMVFGTGGDDNTERLKDMFYNPQNYKLTPYTMDNPEELKRMEDLNATNTAAFVGSIKTTEPQIDFINPVIGTGIELPMSDKELNEYMRQRHEEMVEVAKKGAVAYTNKFIKGSELDTNQISDGYHTFGELYEHRITLFMALCKVKAQEWARGNDRREWTDVESPAKVWMTEKHSDESQWEGWFILGINREKGKQITYHLPMSKWEECMIFAKVLSKAPEFDGHTSADVLERLKRL